MITPKVDLFNEPVHNDGDFITPAPIVKAVRQTLNGIDTDPATSMQAQQRIQAKTFYTLQTNGLRVDCPWLGSVYACFPFNEYPIWFPKLVDEVTKGHTSRGIVCVDIKKISTEYFLDFFAKMKSCGGLKVCAMQHYRMPWDGNLAGSPDTSYAFFAYGVHFERMKQAFAEIQSMSVWRCY